MSEIGPQEQRVNIIQGEYKVSRKSDTVFSTLLGSCVAACISDPGAGIGGMNHFLLPGDTGSDDDLDRFGVHLMELLINGLMNKGAKRDRLEAKLFGGATMVAALGDIGVRNVAFAKKFLEYEGIRVVNSDLGGTRGRRILYWPTSGRARLAYLGPSAIPEERKIRPAAPAFGGEFESFT